MTTFPQPDPAIEPAEHPRNTRWLSPNTRPTYPSSPVPGDAAPSVEALPPTDPGAAARPGGDAPNTMPTGPNTAAGAHTR